VGNLKLIAENPDKRAHPEQQGPVSRKMGIGSLKTANQTYMAEAQFINGSGPYLSYTV